jgi:hypothetical protein
MTGAERVARMRARQKVEASATAPLMYERADWQLFVRPETLPQKAGCEPNQIGRVVLKELVDNALDAGGVDVSLEWGGDGYTIKDDGPGIDPAEVARLYAVNRPLLSSKLKRLPLRGMLGNGLRVVMGAVAAYKGSIVVMTRGRRLELSVDPVGGFTKVISDKPVAVDKGTVVEISLPEFTGDEAERRDVELSIEVAQKGLRYSGPSRPAWYSVDDLHQLMAQVKPETTTVNAIVRDLFGIEHDDRRVARDLDRAEVEELYRRLNLVASAQVGYIGKEIKRFAGYSYAKSSNLAGIGDARIPHCVEAWVRCVPAGETGTPLGNVRLLVNRSPTITTMRYYADSNGLYLGGCGSGPRNASPRSPQVPSVPSTTSS